MRVLWILCLLIGNIAGFPRTKGGVEDPALESSYYSGYQGDWRPASVSQDLSYPILAGSTSVSAVFPSSAMSDFGSVNYQDGIKGSPSQMSEPTSQASLGSFEGHGASDSFEGHGASDYYQGHGASDYFQGKGASNTEQTQDSGSPDGVYSSYDVGYYSNVGAQDEGYDDSKGSVDVDQHVGYDGGYEQDTGTPAGIHVESDTSEEAPEEVFSDVSDLQPVYSYSSRSRYQQGKTAFSQTRYTPWEYQLPSPSNPAVWEPVEDSSKGGL